LEVDVASVRRTGLSVGSLLVVVCATAPALAQFGGLEKLAGKAKGRIPNLLAGREAVSSSLSDAKFGDPSKDEFTPPDAPRPLTTLQRTLNGGFVLEPGYFVEQVRSYCLMAGTHGPGDGDGYLYAPVKGAAAEAVMAIVRNSVRRSDIAQEEIQALLWAVVARARFEDLAPELKSTAHRLLTVAQLAMLNRNAVDVVTGNALTEALGGVPEPLRQIAQAEAQLRQTLTTPGASFAEMERVAVLSGSAPLGPHSRQVPQGRWSVHPDGYYVRYLPNGYSSTRIEIWVPGGSPPVGKEFDPAMHIAVPGNTARQRLIQSGRAQSGQ
jgi:hypothetical protein